MEVEAQCLTRPPPFRINNPGDTSAWEKMAAIKSNILRRWDTAATGVRVCCIKFVQRVIQTGTPGVIADPRVSSPCRAVYRLLADMMESVLNRMKPRLHWYPGITHSYQPESLKLKLPACLTGYSTSSRRIQGMGQICYGESELNGPLQ